MRKLAASLAADVLAGLVLMMTAMSAVVPDHDYARTSVVITEDDPRWDCATMGNRICGINPEAWYAAGEWAGIGARRD